MFCRAAALTRRPATGGGTGQLIKLNFVFGRRRQRLCSDEIRWRRRRPQISCLKGRMLALVRIALKRPYTFVVMAMLIVIFGVLSLDHARRPTSFPAIRIPVVAVVWTYNGLPPDDMSGRVIYFYERSLSAHGQRYRAYRIAVHVRLWRGEDLLPADRQHQLRSRPDHRGVADRAETTCRRASRRPMC